MTPSPTMKARLLEALSEAIAFIDNDTSGTCDCQPCIDRRAALAKWSILLNDVASHKDKSDE